MTQRLGGIEAGGSATAQEADGIGVAGGEQREAAIGDAGAIDEVEEALSQAHARINRVCFEHRGLLEHYPSKRPPTDAGSYIGNSHLHDYAYF